MAAATPDPLLGVILAQRYKLEVRLGAGASGAVYLARHVQFGRRFAVKIVHQTDDDPGKLTERLAREAELAGRLHHPNVIGVVDVGEVDGRRYLVMDFADGPTLADLLVAAPMPADRVIHLARQLCEGLYHAHDQGLIHRDFKPENVIVETDSHGAEVPRIVDFGLAILRESGDSADAPGRLTTNGLVVGTPHYMAPEQAVADPLDHRVDLFALGIIVYEMLSGVLPFDGSGAEIARANLMLDPPPIATRVPDLAVDPLLEAFARALMAKRRDDRPPTAKAARELLDLIVSDRAAAARALGVATAMQTPRAIAATAPMVPAVPPAASADAPVRGGGRGIPTAVAAPLAWSPAAGGPPAPTSRRRRWLVAGAVVLAAGGAWIALSTREGAPPVIATRDTAPPTPVPVAPAPPAPVPVSDVPTAPPPPAPAVVHDAPVATPAPRPATSAHAATTLVRPAPPPPDHDTAAPAHVPPPPTLPAGEVSTAMLASQYKDVGAQITALQRAKGDEAARGLWERYRRIQLGQALAEPPARRAEVAKVLGALGVEAVAATR